MNYAQIRDGIIVELIPEFDPVFPGIPVDQRYSANFLANCEKVDETVMVGYIKTETGFEAPPSKPEPQPEPPAETVTIITMDDLAEQVFDLEVRTTMLEQGVK